MKTNKITFSHKTLRILSGILLMTSVIVFIGLGVSIQYQDLKETYTLANETYAFMETECQKYDNYVKGNSAKSKQDILDKATTLRKFISEENRNDSKFLREFIVTEHLSGVIELDASLSVIAQADMDGNDSYSMWKNVIEKENVKNILNYPKKKYLDQIILKGGSYDVAAASDGKGGLLFCYSSTVKPDTDPYEITINKFLLNNNFYKNPRVIITDESKILAANDEKIEGKNIKKCEITSMPASKWKKDYLTKIKYKGSDWYGVHKIYNSYSIYVLYPSAEVFSDRTNFIIIGFMIYMMIALIVLLIQRYLDRQNLKKMKKQLQIIEAISMSYSSTILLHLERMELEEVKVSERLHKVFEEHMDPERFVNYLCETCVSQESGQKIKEFLRIDTMIDRLRNKQYLLEKFDTEDGRWYSILVIPQRYDKEHQAEAVLIVTRDITESQRAEELSYRDKLTGLYNRNYLELQSGHFAQDLDDYPASLIMADCNYLKRTNDTLGHEYGDLLLKRIARIIKESIPETATAIRAGGDEFLIVCLKCDRVKAEELVSKIKKRMAQESNETIRLSAAFGICTVKNDEVSFEDAYEMADQEMYKEKRSSRE